MAVAIAIAQDQVFDGVRHLVGGVADAILHSISAFFDLILRVIGG